MCGFWDYILYSAQLLFLFRLTMDYTRFASKKRKDYFRQNYYYYYLLVEKTHKASITFACQIFMRVFIRQNAVYRDVCVCVFRTV